MLRARSCILFLLLPTMGLAAPLNLGPEPVVAFVGGSDVASAQFSGHLESLLAIAYPGARFRNLGWEGDTVFNQPRDVGFPPLQEHLRRSGVTFVFLQMGRAEALAPRQPVEEFSEALEKMIALCSLAGRRIALVTPIPLEKADEPLPDLSRHNSRLTSHTLAIRSIARAHSLPCIDLFESLSNSHPPTRLTRDGFQLTARGHAAVALAFLEQLGLPGIGARAGTVSPQGEWSNPDCENVRGLIIEKNQLWFNYWRPENWAFLGGDRVTQPSSRDHRNPEVRWFPREMEKYPPLIAAKEAKIASLALKLGGAAH